MATVLTWIALVGSSTVWLVRVPGGDAYAFFVFIPSFFAATLCFPLVALCLMRFPRGGARVIGVLSWAMAICMAAVAILVWL